MVLNEDASEKTPAQGPFAIHLARIERKIDTVIDRTDAALTAAFEAHQTAKDAKRTARAALMVRTSWAPYAISILAFAFGFWACVRR